MRRRLASVQPCRFRVNPAPLSFLLLQEHQLAPVDLATQLKAFFEGLRRSPGAGQALLQAGAAGLQQQERDDLLAKLK